MSRLSYGSRFKGSRALNAGAIPTDFVHHLSLDEISLKNYKSIGIQDVASDDIIKAKPGEAQQRSEAIVDFWIKKQESKPKPNNPFDRFL
ncbi:hypothetical protein XF24_00118 [candidate division SR1 bacterium Aalborg_AAW-1]|nr:hypothetical protein XF24_00118 [candidate division SR1 bacterium Aalborg_AAW-1]